MKILLASNNKKKLVELRAIMSDFGAEVCSPSELGITLEPEETGVTFRENAEIKARALCAASGLPTVADDSGLEVDALGGRPGVYSARYAGENATDRDRYMKLLGELDGVPDDKRSARFRSSVCFVTVGGEAIFADGVHEGRILREPRGDGGFGYDPVFRSDECGASFGEMSAERKNAVSHRSRALEKLVETLKERGIL